MSAQVVDPGEELDQFRLPFHCDFPYDYSRWRDCLVVETAEDVLFHVPVQILTKGSIVLNHASKLPTFECDDPIVDQGPLKPILLDFATTAGFQYLLWLLIHAYSSRDPKLQLRSFDEPYDLRTSLAPLEVTMSAIRIAHILDAPVVGRALLRRSDVDVYLRFPIEHILDLPVAAEFWHHLISARYFDVFSLEPRNRAEACLRLLLEINPSAWQRPYDIHVTRDEAISDTKHRWRDPPTRYLTGTPMSKLAHKKTSKAKSPSAKTFRYRLRRIARQMMGAVASSECSYNRGRHFKARLSEATNSCGGCLTRLKANNNRAWKRSEKDFPNR